METWLFKVFRSELEDYAKEGRELHMCCQKNKPWSNPTMMTWRLVTGLTLECEVEFVDNKEVLQLLDGRGGVLDVLDEEVGGVLGMGDACFVMFAGTRHIFHNDLCFKMFHN